MYFAGIVRSRVSRTLYTCATKISSQASKPVYVDLKQKIQDKVIQILQNVGGEWQWPKALEFFSNIITGGKALVRKIQLEKCNAE